MIDVSAGTLTKISQKPRKFRQHETMLPGDYALRSPLHLHRVRLFPQEGTLTAEKPAWTLVLCGRHVRTWGFDTPDRGWIPWEEYLEVKKDPNRN